MDTIATLDVATWTMGKAVFSKKKIKKDAGIVHKRRHANPKGSELGLDGSRGPSPATLRANDSSEGAHKTRKRSLVPAKDKNGTEIFRIEPYRFLYLI